MRAIETLKRILHIKGRPQSVETTRNFLPKLPAAETDPDAFDRFLILSAEKHIYGNYRSVLNEADLSATVLAWAHQYYYHEHDLVASRLHEIRLGWAIHHHAEMLADRLSWQQALQNNEWRQYVPTTEWQARVAKSNQRTINDFLGQPHGREDFARYMLEYEERTGILADNIFSTAEVLELYRLMFDRVTSSNLHLKKELSDAQFRTEEDRLNAAVTTINQVARARQVNQPVEKR